MATISSRWTFALLLATAVCSRADVAMPAMFSEHAVLQRSTAVPIFGRAARGEAIRVSLADAHAETQAGTDGQWRAQLDLHAVGNGPFELVVQGKNRLEIPDVVVGEVWVCSGQSNMWLSLDSTTGGAAEVAASDNSLLRVYDNDHWRLCTPAVSGSFSAVGYYFGKNLRKELDAPVGLMIALQPATAIELWISPEAMDSDPLLKTGKERAMEAVKTYKDYEKAKRVGPAPPQVAPPGMFFDYAVRSKIPYGIQGVIWYQGESNVERAWQYGTELPLMIRDWREHWGQGDFPFYICQLPNINPHKKVPEESQWAELREAQAKALSLPHTALAVLIDAGEEADIHPKDKKTVGDRLARIALADTYGRKVIASGPAFKSMVIEGDKIRVHFTHADGGLVAREIPATYQPSSQSSKAVPLIRNSPQSQLEGFAICGEDRQWKWADARIDGDDVVVWSASVPKPIAIRYAWADNPICNLYNGGGLPAGPFRTDDFPVSTVNARY